MIYEQSEITELLNCELCLKPYDIYYEPKMLPCCGKTICNTCVTLIEKQVKENKFICIACKEEDTMPKNGFQINRTVVKLIEKQPKEISRGQEADKLKQNLFDLEQLVNKLDFEMKNGEYLITEDCRELRRQVQLAKEEKVYKINKHCESLLQKIDVYEERCLSKNNKDKYTENNYSKKRANELIKLVNESVPKQNAYLKQLKIVDKETIACNQKMDELKALIEKERKNVKRSIFDDQIMKFEANTTPIDEEFLGKLVKNTIDFSVIIFKTILITLFF